MADLAVQDVDITGLNPSYSAADAAGDRFQPRTTAPVLLHVKNGDVAAHTVTIDDVVTQSPVGAAAFNPDVAVSIPAGEERLIEVTSRFVDSDGWVNLSYDAVTSVTVAVFRV